MDSDIETSHVHRRCYNSSLESSTNKISVFFTGIPKISENLLSCIEYLNLAHELNQIIKDEGIASNNNIILSDQV